MRRAALHAVWLVAIAAPAHAAEEGGSLLYPAINFVLLLAVLVYFARKPIQTFFADRRTAIRKDLDEAAALEAKKAAEEAMQNKTSREEIAQAEGELAIALAQLEAIRKMRHRA